jgi:mannosyltransferase
MTGTMTRPGRWRSHLGGTPLATRTRAAASGETLRRVIGSVWVWPMLATAAIGWHGIGAPELWRDELATWQAAGRSVPQLVGMLHHVDAVLGAYYLLLHFWMALFGDSATAMRAPSLIAMTAAAGVVAVTARRLGGPTAGLAAGLVFAVIPSVSRYGQEARPYAFVTFFAALATLLLLRAMERPSGRRWALYALAIAATGASNLLGLCLLAGHAGCAAIGSWRPAPGSVGRRWEVALGFVLAATVGVTLDLPVIIAGRSQTAEQIGGLARPTITALTGQGGSSLGVWPQLFCSTAVAVAVLVLAAMSLRGPGGRASAYSLLTALVPILLLWGVSQGSNSYWYARYLLFTVPAWAVAAGLGISGIGGLGISGIGGLGISRPGTGEAGPRPPARAARGLAVAVIVALIAALGLPDQHAIRTGEAHNWWSYPDPISIRAVDYEGAANVIAAHERPGDGIVFQRDNRWMVDIGIEYYLRGRPEPKDVFLVRTPAQADRLTAVECADPLRCLRGEPRLWVVYLARDPDLFTAIEPGKAAALRAAHYVTARIYHEAGIDVALMVRR